MAVTWIQKCMDRLDDALRHRSLLGEHRWLRDRLRKPYHWLLNLHGGGITINLGRCVPARIPAEFASKLMEDYEVEEFRTIRAWCGEHGDGLLVDVGCSQGYLSCAALFSSSQVQVVAIDSDLNSLQSTRRVCGLATGVRDRLFVVQALVSAATPQPVAWPEAARQTEARLAASGLRGDPGSHQYICLDQAGAGDIPLHTLDALLAGELTSTRPLFIKCDVEGAELEVLRGAAQLMRTRRPGLLVSVHPQFIGRFGGSVAAVESFLNEHGYTYTVLAVDHEQHWLCRPV